MRDLTVKGIPDGVTDAQVFEFVGVLVERYENAKVNAIPEVSTAIKAAQVGIDSFRVANSLAAKFSKEPVKEEEVLPKDVPQG